jgi:hypothetical protein
MGTIARGRGASLEKYSLCGGACHSPPGTSGGGAQARSPQLQSPRSGSGPRTFRCPPNSRDEPCPRHRPPSVNVTSTHATRTRRIPLCRTRTHTGCPARSLHSQAHGPGLSLPLVPPAAHLGAHAGSALTPRLGAARGCRTYPACTPHTDPCPRRPL